MKPITAVALFIMALLIGGCASTDEVLLDSSKRAPTTSVDVFKEGKSPVCKYKEIAELTFLGHREEELRAQRRFVGQAKKMGGNGVIFQVVIAGDKGGIIQDTMWLFKGKVLVYE